MKWIKLAYRQTIAVPERYLEGILDVTFVAMGFLFLVGIVASVWFFATLRVAG